MAEKIEIKPDQVVSRNANYTMYYDANSTLRKAKSADVVVLEGGAAQAKQPDAPTPTPTAKPVKAEAPFPVDIPTKGEAEVAVPIPGHTTQAPKQPKAKKASKEIPVATVKAKAKTKTAAKKAKTEGGAVRTIGGKPVDISKYEKSKAPGGGTSYHNGDAVAEKLQGKDLETVYDIVARALKVEVKELKSKYKHLNVGMQRMNLGNRLRKVSLPKAA